jgi:hypothetical protein
MTAYKPGRTQYASDGGAARGTEEPVQEENLTGVAGQRHNR